MKSLVVNWRSQDQNPTQVYMYPMSCGGCGEPRVIVVVGMDPWTPFHASTSLAPVVDSPSQKKNYNFFTIEYQIVDIFSKALSIKRRDLIVVKAIPKCYKIDISLSFHIYTPHTLHPS